MSLALTEEDIREAPQEEISSISRDDAIEMGAVSGMFFNRFFLPKTFSLIPAPSHYAITKFLDDPVPQFKALKLPRDFAKTTFCRAKALKKVCYGLTRTGLFTSDAKPHAKKSVRWLSRNIKFNKLIRQIFGLEIGMPDSGDELEILNRELGTRSYFQAQGMTGQLRGLNEDDNRPDFELCDDPCNEENTGTREQIEKLSNLFFGSLVNSLAARSIVPTSELLLAQTPLASGDLIDLACRDSSFSSMALSVFDEGGESNWPAKWSTKLLISQKQGYIDRNQLHIWLREKECRISDPALTAFDPEWISIYESNERDLPDGMVFFLCVDPVPPPKDDRAVNKMLYKGDWEVWLVMGVSPNGDYWFCDGDRNRGHKPDWSMHTFERLMRQWNPLAVGVETTIYQRVLAYNIRQKMQEMRRYARVHEIEDKRKKYNKIIDNFTGPASARKIHIHRKLQHLIEQFQEYPQTTKDDDIDCGSICIQTADECYGGVIDGAYDMALENRDYPDLPETNACP